MATPARTYILGTKGKDTIDGGKGADTIIGGKGNDKLTGGRGADVFFYTTGDGSDVITGYASGEDIISLAGNDSVSYSKRNDDAVLKIGSGNVTLKNAADALVTVVGLNSVASIFGNGSVSTETWTGASGAETVYVTTPAETVTVGGGMVVGSDVVFAIGSGMLKLTGTKGKAVTIISGDTETEYVNGVIPGSETVLLDDTTPADSGVTVTLESSFTGNFSLTAYNTTAETAAQNIDASDVRNSINIYADNSANVIRAGKNGGTITLKDSKDKNIHMVKSGEYDLTRTIGRVNFSGDTVSLASNYLGAFYLTHYADSASNIVASAATGSIELHADDSDNVIRAAKGGGNIYAGKGAGNETVYNIGNDDQIILNNCTTQNVSVSGSDVIITTSSEENITLKDGTGKRIWITGQNWQTYTAETASNGNVAVLWFAADDTNFTTTADFDSLMETPIANSAGALSVGGGDSLSPFAYDFALAHTTDK